MCWMGDARDGETNLARIRREISAHIRASAWPESDVAAAELIVGEILANVLRYAPGPFCAEVEWTNQHPVVHVHDTGPCFEIASVVGSLEQTARESGRGLAIARALGAVITTHRDGGCRVSIQLPVPRHPDAPAVRTACPHNHPGANGRLCPRLALVREPSQQ